MNEIILSLIYNDIDFADIDDTNPLDEIYEEDDVPSCFEEILLCDDEE